MYEYRDVAATVLPKLKTEDRRSLEEMTRIDQTLSLYLLRDRRPPYRSTP
jgi:hypothetical protein